MRSASAARSQVLLFGAFAGRLVLGLGITVVLGRHLAPDALGFVTLVGTLFALAQAAMDLGLPGLALREITLDRTRERPLLEGLMAWRTACGMVLALLLVGLLSGEGDPTRRWVLLGAALTLVLAAPGGLRLAFTLRQAQEAPVATTLIGSTAVLLGSLQLAALEMPGAAFAWLIVGRELLTLLLLGYFGVRLLGYLPRPGFRGRGLQSLAAGALVYGLAALAHELNLQLDVLLVRLLRTEQELGAFSAAFRPVAPLMQLPHLLVAPLLPLFVQAGGRRADSPALQSEVAALFAGLGAIGGATGLAFSKDLIALFYGGRYLEGPLAAVASFGLLSIALGATFALAPLAAALLAAGRERTLLRLSVTALALKVAANLVLLPQFGFVAAAATTAALHVGLALAARKALERARGTRLAWPSRIPLGVIALLILASLAVPAAAPLRALLAGVLGTAGASALLATRRSRRLLRRLSRPQPAEGPASDAGPL